MIAAAAVLLLCNLAPPAAAQGIPGIAWPEARFNPQPLADDRILPMPCGGAMAFRTLTTPNTPERVPRLPGRDFSSILGPFRDGQGAPYLLVGKYEVTRLQRAAVDAYASAAPCPSSEMKDGQLAASAVAWQEAADFADDWTGWLLAEGQGLPDCTAEARACLPRGAGRPAAVRLPTEAEWEFAARGGLAATPEVFAQDLYPMAGGIARHVWSKDNARGQVQPIGTRAPGPLGLHDLYGNVSETMLDRVLGRGSRGPVPVFAVRGGGYYDPPESLRADLRFEVATHNRGGRVRTSDTGFRVVVTAAGEPMPRAQLAEAFLQSHGQESTGYTTAQTPEAPRAAVSAPAVREEGAAEGAAQADQRLAEERRSAADRQTDDRRLADEQRRARLAAPNGVLPTMVEVPGGTFWMGSPESEQGRTKDEGPRHRVTLKPFAIGQTEVTFAQYDSFARATGRRMPRDRGAGRGARPVVDVSWLDANAYSAWLRDWTGDDYRLPSEAEWEYAARAGTETPFWSGACIGQDLAIYDTSRSYPGCPSNPRGPRRPPVPAGSLPANPWGLHEVAGNVAEWVQDCWHADYTGAPTDGGPWLQNEDGECPVRVVRGGGWSYVPWALRSAYRSFSPAVSGQDAIGFRVARSL
jgi:formylglycine-generating enzyme required for sulfatase activity